MNVALVHDILQEYGDTERMLQVLHRMYPNAPVYTASVNYKRLGEDADRFASWDIRSTAAQRLSTVIDSALVRPWLPYFWEAIDLSEYDLVISSSGHGLSKSVLTRPETLHVCYCHTPPRDLWEPTAFATGPRFWQNTWADTRLRQYDFYAAQRVDRFITNSEGVARRIKKFYRRQAEVIPPPVKVQAEGQSGGKYYLYVGSLTHRSQMDLAIQSCNQLSLPLWIAGTGKQAEQLQRMAGPTVRFLGKVPESALPQLYADAKAVLFPDSDADFGVAPVEAMGYGIPVIASERSGLREVILNYRTGLLFSQPTVESLSKAIAQFEGLRFSAQACIERAKEFSESVFISKLEWFIAQALEEHRSKEAMNALARL